MRIGIDVSSLIAQKTGIGSFASYLVEEFERAPQGLQFLKFHPEKQKDMNTPERLCWEFFTLPRKVRDTGADVLYSPGFSPPPSDKIKKIVTVHDLIGLLFPKNVGVASRFYWTYWLPQNLKKADRLVASSECTKRDIVRLLGIRAENIEVVPLAVRESFRVLHDGARVREAMKKYGIEGRYLISVGSLEPRKNYLRLIKAFARFHQQHPDFSLMIIGKPAGAEKELKKYILEKKLGNAVKLLGYVPEEDGISLYNGALGYVIISLYEGFGLPALEAMNCGLTGVVADNSSLPEVTGPTAIQVPPDDDEAVLNALNDLVEDTACRKAMAALALERCKQFSIQATALRMIEIFKKERPS